MDLSNQKKKRRSKREKVIEAVDRVKQGWPNDRIERSTGVSYSTIQGIRRDIQEGRNPYLRTERERIMAGELPKKKTPPYLFVKGTIISLALFISFIAAIMYFEGR